MITTSLHGNNRLIRKTIMQMLPSSFATVITVSVTLMIDTLLSGALLGRQAIATVAIGTPVISIFQALTQTVISSSAVRMAVYTGQRDYRKLNKIYSTGFAGTFALGLIFILACLGLAPVLTRIFGGAGNADVAAQATVYIRAASVCVLMGSMNTFLGKVLTLYGYQKAVFRSALIALLGNVLFSMLYMRLLPDELAIAGLGMGRWTGGTLACIASYMAIKKYKIPLRLKRKDIDLKEFPALVRVGFPSSGNSLADGVVAGLVNNIIVMGFGGDTTALSVYTAVKGVVSFGMASVLSTTLASAPLLGILCGSRDKNGILRTIKEAFKVGLIFSLIWDSLIILALPLLERFYSMGGIPQFRSGVIICFLCLPLWLIVRLFVQFFETTENIGMGLCYSIIPDSICYPILLALLLPVLQYNGIWIAYGANAVPFLIVLYLLRSIKFKTLRLSVDRMLCLDEAIRANVPMLDISIMSNNADVAGISGQVHAFLLKQKASRRTAYMTSLCLEELAADFVEHTMKENTKEAERNIMDIKMFADEETIRIIIRNVASAYNPLDFELDDTTFSKVGVKLAQKVSRLIDYNYVYKMNIVTIEINKALE